MIPVKLQMRNFMCYRDNVPPLYFNGLQTACISGDNGNGKSSLIDAMTWALWGKTRARSDDDIIHQGQNDVAVELDFAIGERLYRIIRKHARPKSRRASGQTVLDFQTATEDGFRSIAGNTLTETQQRITDTLHMDYETFINSAFLRQGHADEFTIKRPQERKDVLANILGLAVYDHLEEAAKEQARQRENERAQLESSIGDIGDELARKPELEAELAQAESQLAQINGTVTEREARLNRQRREKEALENKKMQMAQLEEYIAQAEKDILQWRDQLEQRQNRISEFETLLADREAIEAGYQQLSDLKKSLDELDKKFRQQNILEKRQHELQMAIERAQSAVLAEHRLAQSQMVELEASYQKLPALRDELRQVEMKGQQQAERENALSEKRQGHQRLQAQVNRLEPAINQLEKDIAEIGEKLAMLRAGHEARCPLCETELGEEGLQLIEQKYGAEREAKGKSLKTSQAELSQRLAEASTLEQEISRLEMELNQERAAIHRQDESLRNELTKAENAGQQLAEKKTELAEIEQRLAEKSFAAAEQKALAGISTELAVLGYDAGQHEELRQRLAGLQHYENAHLSLAEAERLINQERAAATSAEAAIKDHQQRLGTDKQNQTKLTQELNALPQIEQALSEAEAEYQAATARQKTAQETLWNLKARLERLAQLEDKRKEKEKELDKAVKEEGIYRELAQAFGKRGIQAMLIESALPEIETEANKLLSRMTDNRMQVKIETQRETKKGEPMETLDIYISDELGTRRYEMFSGGEAFRINFAIRIALSRLLARRAGAPLRTLIVDEGFGTQDSHGLEKIKEAINSIQEDFDKILVITHMAELRDAFPASSSR